MKYNGAEILQEGGLEKNKIVNFVHGLLRAVANPAQNYHDIDVTAPSDPYFPMFRFFDLFDLHSWSRGLQHNTFGKDQESTSEEINFYHGAQLWGRWMKKHGQALGLSEYAELGARLETIFTVLTALNAQSIWTFYQMEEYEDFGDIHPLEFARNHCVGMLYQNEVKYSTWFGPAKEYIHGIQMMPLTTALRLARDPEFMKLEYYDTFDCKDPANYATDAYSCVAPCPAQDISIVENHVQNLATLHNGLKMWIGQIATGNMALTDDLAAQKRAYNILRDWNPAHRSVDAGASLLFYNYWVLKIAEAVGNDVTEGGAVLPKLSGGLDSTQSAVVDAVKMAAHRGVGKAYCNAISGIGKIFPSPLVCQHAFMGTPGITNVPLSTHFGVTVWYATLTEQGPYLNPADPSPSSITLVSDMFATSAPGGGTATTSTNPPASSSRTLSSTSPRQLSTALEVVDGKMTYRLFLRIYPRLSEDESDKHKFTQEELDAAARMLYQVKADLEKSGGSEGFLDSLAPSVNAELQAAGIDGASATTQGLSDAGQGLIVDTPLVTDGTSTLTTLPHPDAKSISVIVSENDTDDGLVAALVALLIVVVVAIAVWYFRYYKSATASDVPAQQGGRGSRSSRTGRGEDKQRANKREGALSWKQKDFAPWEEDAAVWDNDDADFVDENTFSAEIEMREEPYDLRKNRPPVRMPPLAPPSSTRLQPLSAKRLQQAPQSTQERGQAAAALAAAGAAPTSRAAAGPRRVRGHQGGGGQVTKINKLTSSITTEEVEIEGRNSTGSKASKKSRSSRGWRDEDQTYSAPASTVQPKPRKKRSDF
ncbi:unnamed protein product [Amoebophrya sp. A120]|nr:unnamed protein product [Amoebophrya sp. A120]|eukprot:GSA120T00017186001.1